MTKRIKVRRNSKGFKEITTYKVGLKGGFNFNRQEEFEDKSLRRIDIISNGQKLENLGKVG